MDSGNGMSAYFLNHNNLVFSERSFVYLHSVLMVAFLEELRWAKGHPPTENLRQQICATGSFTKAILSGKNTLLTKC